MDDDNRAGTPAPRKKKKNIHPMTKTTPTPHTPKGLAKGQRPKVK